MPVYWDFRKILELKVERCNPCVGTEKSQGQPCGNPINKNDRLTANRLLDQMDRTESLSSSIKHLEQLAELMLCKHWHNSQKRPEYSQVDEIYRLWTSKVEEEYLRVKEEQIWDAKLKARKELVRVKSNAIAMTDEFEQDNEGQRGKKIYVYQDDENLSKPSTAKVRGEDRFVTANISTITSKPLGSAVLGNLPTNYIIKKTERSQISNQLTSGEKSLDTFVPSSRSQNAFSGGSVTSGALHATSMRPPQPTKELRIPGATPTEGSKKADEGKEPPMDCPDPPRRVSRPPQEDSITFSFTSQRPVSPESDSDSGKGQELGYGHVTILSSTSYSVSSPSVSRNGLNTPPKTPNWERDGKPLPVFDFHEGREVADRCRYHRKHKAPGVDVGVQTDGFDDLAVKEVIQESDDDVAEEKIGIFSRLGFRRLNETFRRKDTKVKSAGEENMLERKQARWGRRSHGDVLNRWRDRVSHGTK